MIGEVIYEKYKTPLHTTGLQPSNAGYGGKTTWLWLLKWKRNSNIKSAKARTAAASGALATIGGEGITIFNLVNRINDGKQQT
jgi:hypothetical protein